MNKYLTAIIFLFIICFVFTSCGDKSKNTSKTTTDADSIRTVFNHLVDSTTATWNVMIEEDDQKIAYLQRLLDEVSYTKVYDKKVYDSLSIMVKNLKANRYNLTTMAKSETIDDYDSNTSLVIYNVVTYAQSHPSFKDYPLMNELIRDIVEADNKVIYRRVDYDNVAIAYNKFIESHRDILRNENGALSEKPLFQLTE